MNENMADSQNNTWFYIKHLSTNKVIASCCGSICDITKGDCARSQVVATKPQYTDNELWCWEGHYLKNKSTGLVLDIRKGRLRLIEDTEICLYYKKPCSKNHNQLWCVRPAGSKVESEPAIPSEHPLYQRGMEQTSCGNIIHSLCNSDWVLDIAPPENRDEKNLNEEHHKLILFPQHQQESPTQRWEFVSEHDILNIGDQSLIIGEPSLVFDDNSLESSIIDDNLVAPGSCICEPYIAESFAHGLSPAKRGSQTSLNSISRKSSLEDMRHIFHQTHQHHPSYYQ